MIVGHCVVCGKSVVNPGKVRGFRIAHHTCPCGGALRRGRGADPSEPTVFAVPLPIGQSTAAPRPRRGKVRGAIDRSVLAVVLLLGVSLILAGVLVGSAYRLGLAQGRGDLFAAAIAARTELEAIAPRIDATTQACNALSGAPADRLSTHRGVR